MKNKILFLKIIALLAVFLIGVGTSKNVRAEESDASSDFVIENGVLKKYKGSATVVIIPDGVKEIGGGETLGKNGLNYNNTITKVILPDSVTKIGNAAFYMSSE